MSLKRIYEICFKKYFGLPYFKILLTMPIATAQYSTSPKLKGSQPNNKRSVWEKTG